MQFEFIRQYSADPKNIVVGLVRDKSSAQEKVSAELSGRSNVHLIQADVTDYESLKVGSSSRQMIQRSSDIE